MKNILFVHYGESWIRGSEVCLLNLIKTLGSDFNPVVFTNNASLHSECNQLGVQARYYSFEIPFSWQEKRFQPLSWYDLFKQTLALIKEQRIDCIHINSGAPCQWVLLAARITKTPHLCQLHCHYNLHDRLSLGLNLAPNLVTVSNAITLGLNQDGYPLDRLSVVYNGVPEVKATAMDIRHQLAIPASDKVIISVGSLIKRKGFDRIIKALPKLKSQCHLVIIGEGQERKNLQALTKELQLEQRVHLIGETANVSDYLAGADLFISAARSEAFGLVLVEAFWQHLPVVASNVGGIPEVIEHGVSGLLFESDKGLVNSVDTVLESHALSSELARNGYARAKAQFSIEKNTERLEQHYSKIMRKQTQPSWLSLLAPLKTLFNTRILRGGVYESR